MYFRKGTREQSNIHDARAFRNVEDIEYLAIRQLGVTSQEHMLVRARAINRVQLGLEAAQRHGLLIDGNRVVTGDFKNDGVRTQHLGLVGGAGCGTRTGRSCCRIGVATMKIISITSNMSI